MASRIPHKIQCQLFKNIRRSLTSKKSGDSELEAKTGPPLEDDPMKTDDESTVSTPIPTPPSSFAGILMNSGQYQVCRPRTSPLAIKRDVHNETDIAKKAVALQHLQPSLLPTYYSKEDSNVSSAIPDANTETAIKSTPRRRQFEDSVTRMNITLPLKPPKLAKPFPDPVKVMYSHTISDREKADNMLAETKMMRSYQNHAKAQQKLRQTQRQIPPEIPPQAPQQTLQSTPRAPQQTNRKYSTIPTPRWKVVGEKIPRDIATKSAHKILDISARNLHSDAAKIQPQLKKDNRPSSAFQYIHSSSASFITRKDECKKPFDRKKKPCEWVKKEVASQEKKKGKPGSNKSPPATSKKSSYIPMEPAIFPPRERQQFKKLDWLNSPQDNVKPISAVVFPLRRPNDQFKTSKNDDCVINKRYNLSRVKM